MLNPPEILYLTELTDEQASFMGEWMAAAFAPRDAYAALHCGRSYLQDPEAFKLFFKASVLKVCASGGLIMTTPDLKTCCQLYAPGKEERKDLPSDHPAQIAWKRFCDRVGGEEGVLERKKKLDVLAAEEDKAYGKDIINHFRYAAYAIHKDLQGTGLGRYIHELNVKRAQEAGCLLIWASARNNYGFYEKCGSERVGSEVKFLDVAPEGCHPDCKWASVFQSRQPASPVKIMRLTEITDEQANFMAEWMAEAFAPRDCYSYVHAGASYFDNPATHVLFYKATLLRVCQTGGTIMTTPDLKTCCQIYPPGVQKSGGELPEGSRAHTAWLDFCNASGGEDLVKSRRAKLSALPAEFQRIYGDGFINNYKYAAFAIHKELQGKGIGRYMHQTNIKKAQEEGCSVIWAAARSNYGFYEKCGGERVGTELHFDVELPVGYHPDCAHMSVFQSCQSAPPVEIIHLTELTDEQANFMAEWMADAFAPSDCDSYVHCGVSYFDDPNPHVLFYMFTLLRACATGGMIMTTPDFKTCCQIYPPGVQKNTGELPPDSQAHNAWRAFCNAVGGEDAVKSRMAKLAPVSAEFQSIYGLRFIDNYKYADFAIHKAMQGKGIGRYMHEMNIKKAHDDGCSLIWAAARSNYKFYGKCGSERVGNELHIDVDVPAGYHPDGIHISVMQSRLPIGNGDV